MPTRAVLWDFDGVVLDSEEVSYDLSNKVLAHFNLPSTSRTIHRHRSHNDFRWFVERGIPLTERPVRQHYHRQIDFSLCRLIEGVYEVLEQLRAQDVACAMVSAQRIEVIKHKLREFSIEHHFRHVVGEVSPKTEAIRETCKRLGVACEDALYIGDLHSDVLDGKEAGVTTVLLAPPDYPHVEHADHHIHDLRDLIKLLG